MTARDAMKAGRIILIVLGCLGVLVGLAALAGGAALGWGLSQRDDAGFFQTRTERFETPTAAIATESLDVWQEWPLDNVLATIRVRARSVDDRAVFVGVARTADLERYLADTAYDRVDDLETDPFRVTYDRQPGSGEPATAPGEQAFWETRVQGAGAQELVWDVRGGDWTVVVMNADASPGVAVDASVGAKVDWLWPVLIAVLVFGVLSIVGGVILIFVGARGRRGPPPPALPAPWEEETYAEPDAVGAPAGTPYPMTFTGTLEGEPSRWVWLVKWLLAIPHYIVLFFLWIAFAVLSLVAFFAILFTGRYPRGIFDFNVGVLRWTWRVSFYGYSALATDRYPPFTLERADYPADLDVPYPERLSRGLVLVKWWLLAIPHYLVIGVLLGGTWAAGGLDDWGGWVLLVSAGPGLIGLLTFFAGVALLFTGRYPRDIFALLVGLNRWVYRVGVYAGLMRDEYPPFRLRP